MTVLTIMKPVKAPRKNVRRVKNEKRFSFERVLLYSKVMLIVISISTLLGISGFYGTRAVQQFLSKPIASVLVSGEFKFLSKEQITALISQNIEKSFVRENLESMRKKLEAEPWVDQVVVRRQWPDTLYVDIVEEKPIARWGAKGFINHRGELVWSAHVNAIAHLPQLHGDDDQATQMMKKYQLLSRLFTAYQLKITELKQNALGVWVLHLDNNWQFIVGRHDVVKKIQRFMQVLANNKIERERDIEVVDMRYKNGVAIQWKAYPQHAVSTYLNIEHNI